MHRLRLALVAVAAAILLPACAAPDYVGRAVHRYCDTTTPADRTAVRERVNAAAAPHRVAVDCAQV